MPEPARGVVLVVEDEADIAEVVADLLEVEGYSPVKARNGRQALDLVASVSPVAIVLDMMMPELDGLGFLREYAKRPGRRAPVLAVSAFEDYLPLARDGGADATLRKPYSCDELVSRLAALAAGAPAERPEPPPPRDDASRLRSIFELALHEPSPGGSLDEFVERVARLFDVPIALVSVLTQDRQLAHAMCGLPEDHAAVHGLPRQESFCTHAVVARAALVVQDAAENPLFRDNPLVRERGYRFYAGVPLFERFGHALGTLCIIDTKPRVFRYFDLELLSVLAKRVMAELEWRDRRAREGAPDAAFRYLSYMDQELEILGRDAFVEVLQVESLRAAEEGDALSLAAIAVTPDAIGGTVSALKARFPAGHVARLASARFGVVASEPLDSAREGALGAAGATGRAATAAVPRLLGGAEALLRQVEEALGDLGVLPPSRA